jgi:site-specific recombinase XerD
VRAERATRIEIGAYINSFLSRRTQGLSNATTQQRITVVRFFYAYLWKKGLLAQPGPQSLARHAKLVPPPSAASIDSDWGEILAAARPERLRNRLMLAMSYNSLCAGKKCATFERMTSILHIVEFD